METTPTSREKDTSGREEWHEEDKRKVKKLYSSFLPVRVLTGMGGWGGWRDGVRVTLCGLRACERDMDGRIYS